MIPHGTFDGSIPEFLYKMRIPLHHPLHDKWLSLLGLVERSAIPVILLPVALSEFSQHGDVLRSKLTVAPQIAGTGFILRFGDRFVFVTAAHVMDSHLEGILCLSDGERFKMIDRRRAGFFTTDGTPNKREKDDKIDFAFMEIGADLMDFVSREGCLPIHESFCQAPPTQIKREYVFVGWPNQRAKKNRIDSTLYIRPLFYSTNSIPQHKDDRQFDPKHHLFLDISRPTGAVHHKLIRNQSLAGMSGGPVWALPLLSDFLMGYPPVFLAGLVTEQIGARRNRLVATSIETIVDTVSHYLHL